MLERLESETLVPPLTPLAQPMSDDEDERLPTFEEPLVLRRRLRREARERDAAAHPCVGKLLANLVDVMVLDDPKVSQQDSDRRGGKGDRRGPFGAMWAKLR